MKNTNRIHNSFTGDFGLTQWALILLGVFLAILLAATLETGRAHAAGTTFSLRGAINRFITPNGDAKNDISIHCVENPKDSSLTGKIYDLRGHLVVEMLRLRSTGGGATIAQCKLAFPPQFAVKIMDAMTWDGRSAGGAAVASGVYVYRIEGEDSAVTGTVVVAR